MRLKLRPVSALALRASRDDAPTLNLRRGSVVVGAVSLSGEIVPIDGLDAVWDGRLLYDALAPLVLLSDAALNRAERRCLP
jgi:hypothetical protein